MLTWAITFRTYEFYVLMLPRHRNVGRLQNPPLFTENNTLAALRLQMQ
jgi:hypothetical protein